MDKKGHLYDGHGGDLKQVQVNEVLFPGDKSNGLKYPGVIQSLLTSAESQPGCIEQSIRFSCLPHPS